MCSNQTNKLEITCAWTSCWLLFFLLLAGREIAAVTWLSRSNFSILCWRLEDLRSSQLRPLKA